MAHATASPLIRLMALLAIMALLASACAQQPATTTSDSPPTDASAAGAPAASAAAAASEAAADTGPVVFLSTQFKPVEEAERMRTAILGEYGGQVEFIPEDGGPFNDRIRAEAQGGQATISVLGGLHGDFAPFVEDGLLQDVTPLLESLKGHGYPDSFLELSQLGTDAHYYVPWMQSTYLMAANKQALEHLPEGADVNTLTYEQLKQWAANVQAATGERKLGFPGGPKGLMHRFFQGYLYPSFTGSSGVAGFKTPEAVTMWTEFRDMWQYVSPGSTNFEFMQEPLLSEEVWIAWDHAARLINALKERPDDFVVMPAPAGPAGRGYMPVIAGLAIPKNAANEQGAEALIRYLSEPEQQIATLQENAFFPVIDADIPDDLNPGTRLEAEAVQQQATASDALPSLLPVGLGAKGGEFNKVYLDTFQRIVLNNEPVEAVLQQQGEILQQIVDEAGAACWPPDPPSEGACQVK